MVLLCLMTHIPDPNKIKLDPVLRTYYVKRAEFVCYDISGFFSPISIRDQIIRASQVVERAIHHKLISPSRPLLVVGAGPAGLTAAIKAASKGIETVLVDKGKVLERLTSSERYFSPVQYDWVATHWKEKKFPWLYPTLIPITLYEGKANFAMQSLAKEFHDMQQSRPQFLKLHEYVGIANDPPITWKVGEAMPFLQVDYQIIKSVATTPSIKEFGMGLSCTGFGGERVTLRGNNFVGIEYWNIDKFAWVEEGKVLICGGGDGALQDFLLFSANCLTARDIYESLHLADSTKQNLEREIGGAEDEAKKIELWWNKGIGDDETKSALCTVYGKLHETHSKIAEELLAANTDNLKHALKTIIKPEALQNISLAYKCNHFSSCYPLNRFLAILIGKYIEGETNQEVLIEKSETLAIASAVPLEHICEMDVDECSAYPHVVTLRIGTNCLDKAAAVFQEQIKTYDTVMLRFGIKGEEVPIIFGEEPAFPGLQILPHTLS